MLTIVIPVYNGEATLERAVESVQASVVYADGDAELVIVNDGSTDKTSLICERFALTPRVRIIETENNGVSGALNHGLAAARGDLVAFLAADDYVGADYHSRAFAAMASDLSVDLAIAGITTVRSGTEQPNSLPNSQVTKEHFMSDFVKYARGGLFNSQANKIYRTKLIREHTIRFDEGLRSAEDLIFNLEYLKHATGTIQIVEAHGYYYVRHDASTTVKMASQYDPHHELSATINLRQSVASKLHAAGVPSTIASKYFATMNDAWFHTVVKNVTLPGSPYVGLQAQTVQIRRIMQQEPQRTRILQGKSRSNMARLNRLIYRFGSPTLARAIYSRV